MSKLITQNVYIHHTKCLHYSKSVFSDHQLSCNLSIPSLPLYTHHLQFSIYNVKKPKLYATTKSISLYLCSIYFFLKLCNVYYEMFDNCLRTATASTEEKQSQVWKCSLSNEIYETQTGGFNCHQHWKRIQSIIFLFIILL